MNNLSKKLVVMMSVALVVGSAFSSFATSVDTKESKTKRENFNREEDKNIEMVYGKVSSISADAVVIEVATRKERERKNDIGENNIQQKKENNSNENQKERKMPNFEDRFELTGESKTYNIASADLGRKNIEKDKNENSSNTENKEEKGEKMTYADYKVGDYVRITANKDTPTVATRMRYANQGFDFGGERKGGYKGEYKGSYTGKTKTEKKVENN